jgi:hypothetical protein
VPNVFFQTFVLKGLLKQHCSYLVPDDHVCWAMQEWHGGSTVLGQQPTSARTPHSPRSAFSAVGSGLRLDASTHISPPVLR